MSKVVREYSFDQDYLIPHGAKLVHAGRDSVGNLCAWYEVDQSNESFGALAFHVVGTDQPIPENGYHVLTTHQDPWFWHWYAVEVPMSEVSGETPS